MENNIFTVKQIARETLPRLVDNLVFPNLVYKDASRALEAKQGDTVCIRKPVKLTAEEFNEEDGVTPQAINEDTVDVKLEKIATVDVEISAIESALTFDSMSRLFIEPAAAALAAKINSDGMELYKDIYNFSGKAGETPSGLDAIADGCYELDNMRVPTDMRYAVWDPKAVSKLKQVPALVNCEKCGSTKALRTGAVGKVFGVENYMSQAIVKHETELADAELTLRTAAENASTVIIKSEATVKGNINIGDLVLIDGKKHVITQRATINGTTGTITVYPSVTAAAGAEVKFIDSHTANLMFHPNAFAFVSRPLSTPAGTESYVTTYNGVSLRVVRGYSMKYKREILSMDVLYAFKTIYPELAVRVLG